MFVHSNTLQKHTQKDKVTEAKSVGSIGDDCYETKREELNLRRQVINITCIIQITAYYRKREQSDKNRTDNEIILL